MVVVGFLENQSKSIMGLVIIKRKFHQYSKKVTIGGLKMLELYQNIMPDPLHAFMYVYGNQFQFSGSPMVTVVQYDHQSNGSNLVEIHL